jgi:hypothetical protein
MRLDNTKIWRWKDLIEAFVKQYKYNMDIAPDRTSLSNIGKKDKESIREYAERWRESAAQAILHFWTKRWSLYLPTHLKRHITSM